MKFPLYTDAQIGLGDCKFSVGNLIENTADEDYDTDPGILKRTIAVCKKDCLFAMKTVQNAPKTFQFALHNNLY